MNNLSRKTNADIMLLLLPTRFCFNQPTNSQTNVLLELTKRLHFILSNLRRERIFFCYEIERNNKSKYLFGDAQHSFPKEETLRLRLNHVIRMHPF